MRSTAPAVIKIDGVYHMWYTGQSDCGTLNDEWVGKSAIGYATSADGLHWEKCREPVLVPEAPWEYIALMCPHVLYENGKFRMWYSGGEQGEPDAIGYAESSDGIHWTKNPSNPIFTPVKDHSFEHTKVTASHVMKLGDWYQMFYIGFDRYMMPSVGVARSKDGITGWERHPENPILAGTDDEWDQLGICKPYVIQRGDRLIMFYNGCNRRLEELGVVYHDGLDLGYDK